LFCDTLRRTSGVVKQQPLHLVVILHKAHYIVRKWPFYKELAHDHRTLIRLHFPPPFRCFPTGFPQRFPHLTSAQSPAFPRVFRCHLHSFSTAFFVMERNIFFSRLFGDFPHLFAGSSNQKNGVKAAVIAILRKTDRGLCSRKRERRDMFASSVSCPAHAAP
jgi:hypothetical protein